MMAWVEITNQAISKNLMAQSRGGTSNRGFASMDAGRQREIASMGGKAAHESGNAHEFTPEEAREAGRKGGKARSENRSYSGTRRSRHR